MNKHLLFLLAASIILVACSKDNRTFTAADAQIFESSIQGTVQNKQGPLSGVLVVAQPGGQTTVSGTDGSFTLSKLKSGIYELQFIRQDYRDTSLPTPVTVGLLEAKSADAIKLRYRYAEIRGVVTDADGQPLMGAGIVVENQEGGSLSQTDGKFSMKKVEPGVVRLFSVVQGTGYGYTDLRLESDSVFTDIEVALDKRGGVVKGKVVDSKGKPLANIDIQGYQGALSSVTNSDGTFEMEEVPKEGDSRIAIGDGTNQTYMSGLFLGDKDTLDAGTIVLEAKPDGDLVVPNTSHQVGFLDSTTLILSWLSSAEDIVPIWYSWSLDSGFSWQTTLDSRLPFKPSTLGWKPGMHQVQVRCMTMDSLESNIGRIYVTVTADSSVKTEVVDPNPPDTTDTTGQVIPNPTAEAKIFDFDVTSETDLPWTFFSGGFSDNTQLPTSDGLSTGSFVYQISRDYHFTGTTSLNLSISNTHADGIPGSINQRYGVNISGTTANMLVPIDSTFSFWMSGVSTVTSSRWAYSHGVGLVTANDTVMIWNRCATWGLGEYCFGGNGADNFDTSDSTATGTDSLPWFRYTIHIPDSIQQSVKEVIFHFHQSSWDGTTASHDFFLDKIQGLQMKARTPVVSLNQPPQITFRHDTVPACLGKMYVEEGYTVTDDKDSLLNSSVSINSSKLNLDSIGLYPITYTVQDKDGLSDTAIRYVKVERWSYLDWNLADSMVIDDFDHKNGNWVYRPDKLFLPNLNMIRLAEGMPLSNYAASTWYSFSDETSGGNSVMNPTLGGGKPLVPVDLNARVVRTDIAGGNNYALHVAFYPGSIPVQGSGNWGGIGVTIGAWDTGEEWTNPPTHFHDFSNLTSIAFEAKGTGTVCVYFNNDVFYSSFSDGWGELEKCITLTSTWTRYQILPSQLTMSPGSRNTYTWDDAKGRVTSFEIHSNNSASFDLYLDNLVFYGVPLQSYMQTLSSRY